MAMVSLLALADGAFTASPHPVEKNIGSTKTSIETDAIVRFTVASRADYFQRRRVSANSSASLTLNITE
jgi:hypothetical protein